MFRLTDFEGEENEEFVRGKNEIKDHKLEKTKGMERIDSLCIISNFCTEWISGIHATME